MESTKMINPIHPDFVDKLDPQFVKIYNQYQAPKLRADQVSIEEYRANTPEYTFPTTPGPKPEVGSATIHTIKVHKPEGQINVKVYKPTESAIESGGLSTSLGLLPAHVNFHGGGWVIGNLLSDESWCCVACQSIGLQIIDVDYRLAPEHPFPTQIWDAWAALQWVFSHSSELGIDPSRISIGGLSAGGHLAAVLALMARDDKDMPPLKLQLLIVPNVDARWTPIDGSCDPEKTPYKTLITCEHAPCLPLQRIRWFYNLWLGTDPEDRKIKTSSWLCSPILAESHAGLASASIHTAEFDPLCSEGVAYHEKLRTAGTESTIKVYRGVAHPFLHWAGGLDVAKEAVRDTCEALRKAHAVNPGSEVLKYSRTDLILVGE